MNEARMSRNGVLAISVAASLLLHVALIALSPVIVLLEAKALPQAVSWLTVHLRPEHLVLSAPRVQEERSTLATRPGEIEDLLERSVAPMPAPAPLVQPETSMADLLGDEAPLMPFDLAQSAEVAEEIEANILAISAESARRDLDIARRLTPPPSTRLIGADETLGSASVTAGEILDIDPLALAAAAKGGLVETLFPASAGAEAGIPSEGLPEPPPEPVFAVKDLTDQLERESEVGFLDDLVTVTVDVYAPPGAAEGYYRIRVQPRPDKDIEVLPKNITFVIDASNSIAQRKLDLTASGLRSALKTLRPEDRFNIVLFRDNPIPFRPETAPASPENIAAAEAFLRDIAAKGETNVFEAIRPVIRSNASKGVANIILVLSDGRPTAGEKDAQTIINAITEENDRRNTIFAYGAGKTVNRYLLDLLAYRNRGTSRIEQQVENVDDTLLNFVEELSQPVLVDCEMQLRLIDPERAFPREIPDLYKDQAVTVYGAFNPKTEPELVMRLLGSAGGAKKEVVYKANLLQSPDAGKELARAWAFRKVYFLIGEICRVGEKPELLAELRDLSQQYQISTIYTK